MCTPARFLFVSFMLVLILLLTGLYVGVCCEQEHILSATVSLFEEASAQICQCNLCAENTLKQEMHFSNVPQSTKSRRRMLPQRWCCSKAAFTPGATSPGEKFAWFESLFECVCDWWLWLLMEQKMICQTVRERILDFWPIKVILECGRRCARNGNVLFLGKQAVPSNSPTNTLKY